MTLSPQDLEELRTARQLLEEVSIAARLTSALGAPIERGFKLLPEKWTGRVHKAVEISLQKALQAAVFSLNPNKRPSRSKDLFHKAAAVGSGGVGGAFGLAGLTVELPLSTTIMLRSVADIARSEGEDLSDIEARLSCLQVFALGGPDKADDAAETGYYAVRAAMAAALSEAAAHIAQRGLARRGAPALVRFISIIASRFSASVAEKIAAMAVPAIGAAGGALINGIFIRHFQQMARGHFKVRRLERKYGPEVVRKAWESLDNPPRDAAPGPLET
ncbi:MAG TPA: EcsC family protein [Acidobacteriota bacterium]|nr:EcsC family protein [Acidobacteriota bacterium]